MIRYLLDTNAVGDFINHRHGVPERVREARTGQRYHQGFAYGIAEKVKSQGTHEVWM